MLISNAVSKSGESRTFCFLMSLSVTSVDLFCTVVVQHVQVLQTLEVSLFSLAGSGVFGMKCCFWGFERSLASDMYFFPAFFPSQELAADLCRAGNGICCLKHKQIWKFLHLHTVSVVWLPSVLSIVVMLQSSNSGHLLVWDHHVLVLSVISQSSSQSPTKNW